MIESFEPRGRRALLRRSATAGLIAASALLTACGDEPAATAVSAPRTVHAAGQEWRLTLPADAVVKEDDEIVSGVAIMETNGHTQGHVSVELKAGSDTIVVLGDALTHPIISFEYPDWQPASDHVPDQAAQTRRRLLDRLHASKAMIIGYHLPPPGIGRVIKKGSGFGYKALG